MVFATFHRQMAVFRGQVREMLTKYKMLWFFVDTHHGQRYFFICGCKRTVTKKRRQSSDFRIQELFPASSERGVLEGEASAAQEA